MKPIKLITLLFLSAFLYSCATPTATETTSKKDKMAKKTSPGFFDRAYYETRQ
jgi:hypothetical protein